jgi:uncharacterized protein YcbK (DUF882 family)
MGRQITKNFNEDELKCTHCGDMHFTDLAVQKLQKVRDRYNKPMYLTSAYRCPVYNNGVSSTGFDGPHTVTENDNITVDVKVSGKDAYNLIAIAIDEGFTGVGVSQKGPHKHRFIHLDCIEGAVRPWIWSY